MEVFNKDDSDTAVAAAAGDDDDHDDDDEQEQEVEKAQDSGSYLPNANIAGRLDAVDGHCFDVSPLA